MSKKQKPIILNMPPNEYDIKVEKLSNEISVRWAATNNNNGEAMSIRFQNEIQFLDFCDIISKAEKIYLGERNAKN